MEFYPFKANAFLFCRRLFPKKMYFFAQFFAVGRANFRIKPYLVKVKLGLKINVM
jgi:hypothetical protein